MVEQVSSVNILPSGLDERQKFIDGVNEIIKLKEILKSTQEALTTTKNRLYEQHKSLVAEPIAKKDFNSKLKYAVAEALDANASKISEDAQDGIDVYNAIKNKLI